MLWADWLVLGGVAAMFGGLWLYDYCQRRAKEPPKQVGPRLVRCGGRCGSQEEDEMERSRR